MTRTNAVALVIGLALAAGTARADVPATLPVHGFLTDAQGQVVDGNVSLRFSVYDSAGATTPIFTETHAVVTVDEGFFNALLGSQVPLDLAMFRGGTAWVLGVAVDGDPEMTPRVPLAATPFAALAQYAVESDTLGGLTAADFRLAADPIAWTDIASLSCGSGQVPRWSGTMWVCGTPIYTELDPAYTSSAAASISVADMATWDAAYGWGDHAAAGYLTSESDPSFAASAAAGITGANVTSWNTAYGWGDHAAAGYALSSSLAPVATSGAYGDLTGEPAYTVGDRLIFAQDAEQGLIEFPPAATAYVKMNETSAIQAGSVRVEFEAYIQSGPDYWAWKITVDGTDVMTGSYASGLHPSNTASVHAYRRYQLDVPGIAPGSRIAVWMKPSDGAGGGFGSGVDQYLYMKRFRVMSGTPTEEGGVYTAATWRGRIGNPASIVGGTATYSLFTEVENGNPDVFQVVTTGSYGVRFLRAGHVMWAYDQDVISTGPGGYVLVRAKIGQDPDVFTLISGTGTTVWDNMHNSGVAQVTPGDALVFEWGCNGCDITAMDEVLWSHLSLFWMGHVE